MKKKHQAELQIAFPTGKAARSIDFTGYVYASHMPHGSVALIGPVDRPVFMNLCSDTGVISDQLVLPIFKTADALRAFFERLGIDFTSIKQIKDGISFLEDVSDHCKVVADPFFTPEGRVRFLHITMPGER